MKVLVTGAAASGKSAYAEQVACTLSPTRTYLAAMRAFGEGAHDRIARHHALRQGKGFETIECAGGIDCALQDARTAAGVVLLEDMGNVVANALFAEDGSVASTQAVHRQLAPLLAQLLERSPHAVVVANEIGCDGSCPTPETFGYLRLLGALTCQVAASCDVVVEVAAGVACTIKGGAL